MLSSFLNNSSFFLKAARAPLLIKGILKAAKFFKIRLECVLGASSAGVYWGTPVNRTFLQIEFSSPVVDETPVGVDRLDPSDNSDEKDSPLARRRVEAPGICRSTLFLCVLSFVTCATVGLRL